MQALSGSGAGQASNPLAVMDAVWVGGLDSAPTPAASAAGGAHAAGGVNGWAGLALTLGITSAASAPAPSLQLPSPLLSGDRSFHPFAPAASCRSAILHIVCK